MKIYHTINSGLIIMYQDTTLWVDVLHGKSEGFSSVPISFLRAMDNNTYPAADPDGLVFTHAHSDHYDEALAHRLCSRYPSLPVIMPEKVKNCENITQPAVPGHSFIVKEIEIIPFPTKHDGAVYADVPHTSLIIKCGQESFLISGDAEFMNPEEYHEILQEYKPAFGFFNVYQIRRPSVHKMIRDLQMKHVFLYHFGYPQNDKFHYIELAQKTLKRHPEILPTPKLLQPMHLVL